MEWEFTPGQVVKGEVAYGLEQFRADLAREVRMNLAGAGRDELDRTFGVLYDMCHWLATGRNFEEFLIKFSEMPFLVSFLRDLKPHSGPNVAMLGAILQRLIMDRMERGTALEQAVEDSAAYHATVAATPPPILQESASA